MKNNYFKAYPRGSIRSISNDLELPYFSMQWILKKHRMHNLSFIAFEALHSGDQILRANFCQSMVRQIRQDPQFFIKYYLE